jgi:hypothetical protein
MFECQLMGCIDFFIHKRDYNLTVHLSQISREIYILHNFERCAVFIQEKAYYYQVC